MMMARKPGVPGSRHWFTAPDSMFWAERPPEPDEAFPYRAVLMANNIKWYLGDYAEWADANREANKWMRDGGVVVVAGTEHYLPNHVVDDVLVRDLFREEDHAPAGQDQEATQTV